MVSRDLTDAEQADDGDQEVEAVEQLGEAKSEPQAARDGVEADGRERQSRSSSPQRS